MASREVRRAVYRALPLWGDAQLHGYLPGLGDGIPSGNKPDSRLPIPDEFLDLSCAFAAMNPDPRAQPRGWRFSKAARRYFTPHQQVIWLYYSPDDDAPPPDTTKADAYQWEHERERERAKVVKAHDSERDALVGAALGLKSWKVRRLRSEAVWEIAAFVRWDLDEAA